MSAIAVISSGVKFISREETVSCIPVFYVCGLNTRRKLRRFVTRNHIDRAVVEGVVPEFTRDELAKLGVTEFTGDNLMRNIYPRIISRAAKMSGACEMCTVYDTFADGLTIEIIKCAAYHFRYVSLETESDATHIASEIMSETGLALKFGKGGGVGIIRTTPCENHTITADIRGGGATLFTDEKRHLFTAPIAEAVVGVNAPYKVLEEHKIKIHSLC